MTPPAEWFRQLAEVLHAQPTLAVSVSSMSIRGDGLIVLLRGVEAEASLPRPRAVERWAKAVGGEVAERTVFESSGRLLQPFDVTGPTWIKISQYAEVEGPTRPPREVPQ